MLMHGAFAEYNFDKSQRCDLQRCLITRMQTEVHSRQVINLVCRLALQIQ